jgi:hypothetical protein
VIVTFTDWPGERTLLAGLKVNCTGAEPGDVLVEPVAVQLNWPWAFASSVRVTTQGLETEQETRFFWSIDQAGALQLQGRVMSFGNPETVMVARAGQTVSGIKTVAVVDRPAGSDPVEGLMLMPFIPLEVALQDQST